MRIPISIAVISALSACGQVQVLTQDLEERASGVVYAVAEPETAVLVPPPRPTAPMTSLRPLRRPDQPTESGPLLQAVFREPRPRPAEYFDAAFYWIDANEHTDRSRLREFLGVDPRQTEWCAAFVNAVLHSAGHSGSESVSEFPLLARSFLDWGDPVDHKRQTPEPGDVVVFPRGRQSWQGHVGFFVDTVVVDGKLYWQILGGNQKNSVRIDLYDPNRALGVRRLPAERVVETPGFWRRLFVG